MAAKRIRLEIDLISTLLDSGWVRGHAPEGVRAERLKYRTEDGEWQAFHKPIYVEALPSPEEFRAKNNYLAE